MIEGLPNFINEADSTPYIAHNGIHITEYSKGHCIGAIKIEAHHKNLHGSVHGGCIFSLADTIASYTAMTLGTVVTTLNASINYFHPAMNTEYLYCKGEIAKAGKTVTVVKTVFYGDDNTVFGDASFSCYVLRNR